MIAGLSMRDRSALDHCIHLIPLAPLRSSGLLQISHVGAAFRAPLFIEKVPAYSITSSARASSDGGTSRPSALAVLPLMTSSYLVGACTGRCQRLLQRDADRRGAAEYLSPLSNRKERSPF